MDFLLLLLAVLYFIVGCAAATIPFIWPFAGGWLFHLEHSAYAWSLSDRLTLGAAGALGVIVGSYWWTGKERFIYVQFGCFIAGYSARWIWQFIRQRRRRFPGRF